MEEDNPITELADSIATIGVSATILANAMSNLGTGISTTWVARNILGWSDSDISNNFVSQSLERRIRSYEKQDRQLYLKEIQRYTGYKITLNDLENA